MNFKKLLINSTMLITAGLAFVMSTNTHQVKAASSNQTWYNYYSFRRGESL